MSEYRIPRPYTDWEKLIDLYRECDTREKAASTLFCLATDADSPRDLGYEHGKEPLRLNPLKKTSLLTISEARQLASIRFCECMETKQLTGKGLFDETGFGCTITSKLKCECNSDDIIQTEILENGEERLIIKQGLRPFSALYDCLPGVAAYVFNQSVHEIMFGEKGKIVLPRLYSELTLITEKLSDDKKSKLIEKGQKYREIASEEYIAKASDKKLAEKAAAYGQYRPQQEVFRERLNELCWDIPDIDRLKYIFFSNNDGSENLKLPLKKIRFERNSEIQNQSGSRTYLPSVDAPMVWTLLTRADTDIGEKALDYFISNDYVFVDGGASKKACSKNRIPIFRFDNREDNLITDKDTLRILSFCVALPEGLKEQFISEIYFASN